MKSQIMAIIFLLNAFCAIAGKSTFEFEYTGGSR